MSSLMPISVSHEGQRGVYGLTLEDEFPQKYLVRADSSWPLWKIRWDTTQGSEVEAAHENVREEWSPNHAMLSANPGGYAVVDREAATTTLFLRDRPSDEALAHPYLSTTGIVCANWLGRTPFHAGAFVVDGRAWGVIGGREAGKSSTLMWLHSAGWPILTDDLLIVDGPMAYAGPRCLDLRESAARQFSSGRYLGVVGARERWRIDLPQLASIIPFGGWVRLEWGDEIKLAMEPLVHRMAALAMNRALLAPEANMSGMMDLLHFPMLAFTRTREWARMDQAMESLLTAIDGLAHP